jgi:hypothetical protein
MPLVGRVKTLVSSRMPIRHITDAPFGTFRVPFAELVVEVELIVTAEFTLCGVSQASLAPFCQSMTTA